MRLIKFRAWDKKREEKPYCMYTVKELFFDVNDILYGLYLWSNDGDGTFIMRQSRDVELMQFTGLTDKNGKEIYEGDIVASNKKANDGGRERGVVEWRHHEWVTDNFIKILFEELEVIGNIYETPDLLKL